MLIQPDDLMSKPLPDLSTIFISAAFFICRLDADGEAYLMRRRILTIVAGVSTLLFMIVTAMFITSEAVYADWQWQSSAGNNGDITVWLRSELGQTFNF